MYIQWQIGSGFDQSGTATGNKNDRARRDGRGVRRSQVMAPETDQELLRMLALRLAEGGLEADQARDAVRETVVGESSRPGELLAALRCSPLVSADLNSSRMRIEGRMIDL